MTSLKALAAALVLGTALSSACFAQAQPADPSSVQPAEEVAPATEGAGTSDQHIEAVGGAVQVDVHASGDISVSTDSGQNAGAGELGASVNGIGVSIGGGGSAGVPGLPDSGDGGGPNPTPEAGDTDRANAGGGAAVGALQSGYDVDADGDGRISSAEAASARQLAGAADDQNCRPVRVTGLQGDAPEQIRSVDSSAHIRLLLLCAAENSLDAAQTGAIAENPVLSARLGQGGFTADDVVAISLRERGTGTLYVVERR